MWASQSFSGAETVRPAAALLIGARAPLRVIISRRQALVSRAVLIAPDVTRSIDATNAGFFSLSLDPAHPGCRHLRDGVLGRRRALDLESQLTPRIAGRVAAAIDAPLDCEATRVLADDLLRHFFPTIAQAPAVDPRVSAAAAFLRERLPTRVNMRQLAEHCHLSAGRLTHLFTDELGVSVRTYLRWVKLCKAAALFGSRPSVADAVAEIGFTDTAHLYRVFRGYFAVKPSLIADRTRVHVHTCPAAPAQVSR